MKSRTKLPFKTAQLSFESLEDYQDTIASSNIKILDMDFENLKFIIMFNENTEKAYRELNSIYAGIMAGTIKGFDFEKSKEKEMLKV